MPVVNTNIAETINIEQNGTYDVARYTTANVNTPAAPEIYRVFRVRNGVIENSITTPFMPLPSTATDISDFCYYKAYASTPESVLSGAIDLSSLTTLSGHNACQSMFSGCRLTSVDLSGLTTISGQFACQFMFQDSSLTSADLSSLTMISGMNACNNMFNNCRSITSADLSSLTTISGSSACQSMFSGCRSITSADLSSLTTISGSSACQSMFYYCTGITSVDLSGLTTISGSQSCQTMFNNCTSLATVYIGGTTEINFGTKTNQFSNMFYSCTQNIDVYAPAASKSAIEAFSGYPNFGATGTVTWHWNTATE